MRYIRDEIPSFAVPPYRGERYPDRVPDTLDVQEMARLAVNGLTGPTDPDKDHLLYFNATFTTDPPHMWHRGSDICQTKFEEALPLMRLASGSSQGDHVDPVWMGNALRQIGPDGLFYWPRYRWVKAVDWGLGYPGGSPPAGVGEHYAVPLFCGRRMGAMTVYRQRDPDGPWDAQIRHLVQGLWSVAIQRDGYAYFPQGEFYPGRARVRDAALPVGIWSSLVGWTIQGLAQYHRASGHEPAVELAARLARYLVHHGRYYGPEGQFLPNYAGDDGGRMPGTPGRQGFEPGPPDWKRYIHFQHHMVPLLGLLDHALAAGDPELAQFVRSAFEWARRKGVVEIGYFPENIDHAQPQGSELCEVAGMIGLALKLSAAGLGDYWDDADRWLRNQFVEGQLRATEWAYRRGQGGRRLPDADFDPEVTSIDRVPERNLGAFAGWPQANDWGPGIMHCCTGNATRALYYVWEHMLSWAQGTLSLNLLLNRASGWADVHSHIPCRGQVEVVVKQPCQLRMRLPEWVEPEAARGTVNGRPRPLGWAGRYALVGPVLPGDEVVLHFPIAERQTALEVEGQRYAVVRRGNEVVDIDPPGPHCPLYQRAHYRSEETPWRRVERFVPAEAICW
ncbi:MAG: hypothetical protein AB1505_20150 [Candidatus Latescibacterota bacterium]